MEENMEAVAFTLLLWLMVIAIWLGIR